MNNIQPLLNLPLGTLAVLGAGYMGYRIAYTGQAGHHRPTDVVFISMAFGLLTKLLMAWLQDSGPPDELIVLTAILITLAVAAIWRKWGVKVVQEALRRPNLSFSDGKVTAWDTMRVSTNDRSTQLIVRTRSGVSLMCDYLKSFNTCPHGPCLFGEDGSVSLYVTHLRQKDGDSWMSATWTKLTLGFR